MSAESTTLDQLRIKTEQGDAKAQRNFGGCYAKGNGVPQDIAQAVARP